MSRACDIRRLIALLVVFLCPSAYAFAQTAEPLTKNVLAIHLNRANSPRFDGIFRQIIGDGLPGSLNYYSEFIALERLDEPAYRAALTGYLKARYDDLDLVIASSASVLEFLNQTPELFQGVPLVFSTRPDITGRPGATGVVGTLDLAGTVLTAIAAQPETQNVFVVSGSAPFDKSYAEIFRQQSVALPEVLTVHELAGLPFDELKARLSALPPRSIVFYLAISDDGEGRSFLPFDQLEMVTKASASPVYTWNDVGLGRGIVGGLLRSTLHDATETAKVALRVLRGERPDRMPAAQMPHGVNTFDWRELRRWNISESRLPAGSVVAYKPLPFLEQYGALALGGGLVFVAQLGLIGALLAQRSRRRAAEMDLRQSEARHSAILRALPDLIFVMDRNGTYLDFHARDRGLLFVPPERFVGRTVREIMPAELAETVMKAIERTLATQEVVIIQYELPMDETRYFETRLVPAGNDKVLSVVRDVTDAKRAQERNRELAGRLIVSQEQERQRIARELHDDLSQKIAMLNIDVDRFASEVREPTQRARLTGLSSQAEEIANDLYHLSHELHPSRLRTLGLVESVRLLCKDVTNKRDVLIRFTHSDLPEVIEPSVSLCLYRIVQEALNNVVKHSQAREVTVLIEREGEDICLRVRDTGVGFDAKQIRHAGLGLISMRERVAVLDGNLAIESTPGAGTRVVVQVPLEPPVSAAHRLAEPA